MSNYRQLHTRMWSSDTWFVELKTENKLLFIYFFSNERASVCGLYEIPVRIISFETGLNRDQIQNGIEVFTKADKVKYDFETGVIWVKNMMKYQSNPSPKVQARIKADIKSVPECGLKSEFLRWFDTVSVQYAGATDTTVSVSNTIPVPDSVEGEGTGEGEVFKAFQENIGVLTPFIADALKADMDQYTADWVLTAIDRAVKNEKRSLSYVEGTLKGWKRDGLVNPSKQNGNGKHPPPPQADKSDEVVKRVAERMIHAQRTR